MGDEHFEQAVKYEVPATSQQRVGQTDSQGDLDVMVVQAGPSNSQPWLMLDFVHFVILVFALL